MKCRDIKKRVISTALAAALVATSFSMSTMTTFAGTFGDDTPDIVNEWYANGESLQPLPGGFHVDTLMKWTPDSDPDAKYARASIPLAQNRFNGPLVNSGANPDAKLMLCTLSNSDHDHSPTQGSDNFDSYTFTHWQYADTMVYWAGSSEGIFVIPTPDMIDSAHKNGVKITATLGFPWGNEEGITELRKMTQKEGDRYPVGDKMAEIARYYGFDGYFFNQESFGGSAQDAEDLNALIRYMNKEYPDMYFNWYDSMTVNGNVSYGDGVNDENKIWMDPSHGGGRAVDEFFMNYNWTTRKVEKTIETMKSINRSQFDAFAGFEMQQYGINGKYNFNRIMDDNGKLKLSIALFCPNSTQGFAKDPVDFHNQENRLYVTSTGDPRNEPIDPTSPEAGNKNWVGLARLFADKSVITTAPFVTNFNTGHGKNWYIDGAVSREKQWNNRSMQDILPTWTWMIDSTGANKLAGAYDFDTAYNGGNSIKFTGTLDGRNNVMLYSTNILNAKTASVTYKVNKPGSSVKLGVCYGDSYARENFKYHDLKANSANPGEWTTTTVELEEGKINALSLEIDGQATDYQLNIGRIALLDNDREALTGPSNVVLDEIMYNTTKEAQVRMYWDSVADASHYEVYRVTNDGREVLVNATPSTALYIPALERELGQENVTLKVVPVNKNGVRGTAGTLTFKWQLPDNATTDKITVSAPNVALNAQVTGRSGQGDAEPAEKALDGTALNGSKWCVASARTGFMSIKLKEPKTVKRVRVEHAEFGGEAPDMNTRDFQIQYKDNAGQWQTALDIKNNKDAVTDEVLKTPVTATEWKLNITNADNGSKWGGVRIYEWQMFESNEIPRVDNVAMNFAFAKNNKGATDTFTLNNVPKGNTVSIFTSVDGKDALATKEANGEDKLQTITFENLDFGANAGRVWYTLKTKAENESNRLSTAFEAENAQVSPQAKNVSFKYYETTSKKDGKNFVDVIVNDLQKDDVVYVYEKDSEKPIKLSNPVEEGKTSATVTRVPVVDGGTITLQIKRSGMIASEKYDVTVTGITEKTPEYKAVCIDPDALTQEPGYKYDFNAKVIGTNYPDQSVTWSVSKNTSDKTTIDENGTLTIADNEKSHIVVVTATSNGNKDISDSVNVKIYGNKEKVYNVTISDTIKNGKVEADKATAPEGATVALTVTANEGYKLKEGSLKVNDTAIEGTSFTMPAGDVTITAEFEEITTKPDPDNGNKPNPDNGNKPNPDNGNKPNPDNSNKPNGNNSSSPATGDHSNALIPIVLIVLSLASIITVVIYKKKSNNSK